MWPCQVFLSLFLLRGSLCLGPQELSLLSRGGVVVVENWASLATVSKLSEDASRLYESGLYAAPDRDTLLRRGASFDRSVFRESRFSDFTLGDGGSRSALSAELGRLRTELAGALGRPSLKADEPHRHEASYTRFGPGASLKYHVDEHHEELKGRDGWTTRTRRSISWLVYLNQKWDESCGGQLRCYERATPTMGSVGASTNGDLQVGWLSATERDPLERPVFLDSTLPDLPHCQLYYVDDRGRPIVISRPFSAHPVMFIKGGDLLLRDLYITDPDAKSRYGRIEDVVTPISRFFSSQQSQSAKKESSLNIPRDVAPSAGTLVLFDSVTVPHEVLETAQRPRFAASGWFHEDQQPHLTTK